MALSGLINAVRCLSLAPSLSSYSAIQTATPLLSQVIGRAVQCQRVSSQLLILQRNTASSSALQFQRGCSTWVYPRGYEVWKVPRKYTIRPIRMTKTGGRDHTGRIRVHGIGGGHKQRYRMIDFQRLNYEPGKEDLPFQEKVVQVRYDPCRSADIALVAGGKRKRWIIATENMKEGDLITTSGKIGRMAVLANEGDAYPLGALAIGTLINNLELFPGAGSQFIRAAGTCGILLRKVNGTAIVQLPSKRQVQVLETCVATVGRVSNIDHNKRIIGKAGRNRWLGKRPSSGKWHRKGGWAGRKIRPLPPMKSYVNLPSVSSKVS